MRNKAIFFRSESYIDKIDEETYEKLTKDDVSMKSIEFGVIPLQTIFDQKILDIFEKRKCIYDEFENKKKERKSVIEIKNDKQEKPEVKQGRRYTVLLKKKDNNNTFNDFLYDNPKIEIKIDNKENYGKIKIYKNDYLLNEIIDHNDKIIDIFYNPRLNMFATISLDGLACIYILPGKLISIIKHPNNLYFDKIFLSSNPFPTVITFDKKSNIISSYSLSGIIINQINLEDKDTTIKIEPMFNIYGGGNRDRIKVELNEYFEIYNLPFFDFSPNGRRKSTVKK
jgi:hypothetical protein